VPGGDLMWHIQKGHLLRNGHSELSFRLHLKILAKENKSCAAEVCLVLKFFHAKGILYRSLKLDNIMLALDGHIKS
jgi:serine/threonine protein kinase